MFQFKLTYGEVIGILAAIVLWSVMLVTFKKGGCHRECCVKEAVGVSTFLPPKIPATDSLR